VLQRRLGSEPMQSLFKASLEGLHSWNARKSQLDSASLCHDFCQPMQIPQRVIHGSVLTSYWMSETLFDSIEDSASRYSDSLR
jgi:hypothetical protein